MTINWLNHEKDNWHVERILADKIEFSQIEGGKVIVNEGEMVLPIDEIISIIGR